MDPAERQARNRHAVAFAKRLSLGPSRRARLLSMLAMLIVTIYGAMVMASIFMAGV